MYNKHILFEFDSHKESANRKRHAVGFDVAKEIFIDPEVMHFRDLSHSLTEERWISVGKVRDGRIMTVWYTWRGPRLRIIGAAQIRKWRKVYEKRKIAGYQEGKIG